MNKTHSSIVLAFLLIGLVLQGFQCGSSEFTGAKVREQQKDYKEAVRLYKQELVKNPANHEAWFRLGCIYGGQLKDYDGMISAFREAEKLSPSYKDEIYRFRYNAWVEFITAGDQLRQRASKDSLRLYDQAIDEFKKAEGVWPDTSLTYKLLASVYYEKGDFDNVIKCQEKIWKMDQDIEAYKRMGNFLIQQGVEKKEQFKTANEEALKAQANLKEIDKGSLKSEVMKAFGAPDSQTKDKKNSKRETWKYNQYGLALVMENEKVVTKKIEKKIDIKVDSTKYYQAMDKFSQAIAVCEDIKKKNPKDNENLNRLLYSYFESNRIQEAISTFTLAVENDPGNKNNHYVLGILYRMVNNYDKAVSEFAESITIDPDYSDALTDLGVTYYNWGVMLKKQAQEKGSDSKEYKKKFEAALPYMEKVTEIKGDDARNWEALGTIYAQLGYVEKATKALDMSERLRKEGK